MENANTWLITGVSSGFGRELAGQLLAAGKTVVGTVRRADAAADLAAAYPDTLDLQLLDVRDVAAVRQTVDAAWARHGRIDVLVSNAGYGLFGCAEELSDEEVDRILETNLRGSIALIRAALPHLRTQRGGRIVQISSYGGTVAYAANSMYHATKFGIEGFCESVAQEVAPFGVGVSIVEPGGARTEFRYGSARVAELMPEYAHAHGFLTMLDPANGLAPGDPARMCERIVENVAAEPAPLRLVLGRRALDESIRVTRERLEAFEAQRAVADSVDFAPGE